MIQVSGMPFQPTESWNIGKNEKEILQQLQQAQSLYSYPSINGLLFEIKARKNIIDSAKELAESEAVFATFRNARCNPKYWNLTEAGGFLLKTGVNPSDAILDIYRNGSLYKFECATGSVITLYHGILKSIGRTSFNSIFPTLYLYSWHTDDDLGMYSFYANHYIPGDVVYFNNPDYNPKTPWFRGVNAVAMSDGQFFGHGFGIRPAEEMIEILNKKRRLDSQQSAYLTGLITRPSFNRLAGFSNLQDGRLVYKTSSFAIHHNKSSVSFKHYLFELSKQMNN